MCLNIHPVIIKLVSAEDASGDTECLLEGSGIKEILI